MAENRQLANVKSAKNDEFYFKFRNVLYSSGWAGWGFESNVTVQAVNVATHETLGLARNVYCPLGLAFREESLTRQGESSIGRMSGS